MPVAVPAVCHKLTASPSPYPLHVLLSKPKYHTVGYVLQASEEIDAMRKLNADRRKLAFGSAQADIDEKYRLMSAELQKSREELEV